MARSGETVSAPVTGAQVISFETSSHIHNYEFTCFVEHAALLTQSITLVSAPPTLKPDSWTGAIWFRGIEGLNLTTSNPAAISVTRFVRLK